jgi:hypothetical protein
MLKSLPTPLSKHQLDNLLGGFPANADIHRHDTIVTVYAPNGTKVLSAANVAPNRWHVMAVPGLISTTTSNGA